MIHIGLIRPVQQIVYTDMVKIRQRTENMGRNHPLSTLIIGICSLWDVDGCAYLCLRQISILPQLSNSSVSLHNITNGSIV